MKWTNHVPAWGVTIVIGLVLILPKIIQHYDANTVLKRLGEKTCGIYRNGNNLTQQQAFISAMKELNVSKDTIVSKATEGDLPAALAQCGISDSMSSN
jgi:hypothetical protein